MRVSTFFLALILAPMAVWGAALDVSALWGGPGEDSFRDLAVAADGSLYVVGLRYDENDEDFDAWLMHLDADGALSCETRFGGSGDDAALAVAVDPAGGGAYVVGTTASADVVDVPAYVSGEPDGVAVPVVGVMGSDPETLTPSVSDAFLARVDDRCRPSFFSYIGGAGRDSGRDVAVYMGTGGVRIYVVGSSDSDALATDGAYQTNRAGLTDLFVARFNDQGERLYLSYLGGGGEDWGSAVALAADGDVAVAGFTASAGLAVGEAWDTRYEAGTCAFDPAAPFLVDGHACYDIVVARFDPNLKSARFVTYLGGAGDDYPSALLFDAAGNLLLTGATRSRGAVVGSADEVAEAFPLSESPAGGLDTDTGQDAFLLSLAGDGGSLLWSRFLRGGDNEFYNGLALGPNGEIYLAGHAWSEDIPWVRPLQTEALGGEGRVTALDAAGTVAFDSLLGGVDSDFFYAVAGDGFGRLWLAGGSRSPVPGGVAPGGDGRRGGADAWLARVDLGDDRSADLALEAAFDRAQGALGERVVLTLGVSNRGGDTAPATRLLVHLPSGVEVEAPADCRTVGVDLLCPLGDLAVDERRDLALTLIPRRSGTLQVRAAVAAAVSQSSPQDGRVQIALDVPAPPLSSAWGPLGLLLLIIAARRR